MYTINLYTINFIGNKEYLEQIERKYELKLSSLYDVKSFLHSDFYETVLYEISHHLEGIVVTDKDEEIIYKECFLTDTLFDVYTNEIGETIYKEKGINEDNSDSYVMIDKHKLYYGQ